MAYPPFLRSRQTKYQRRASGDFTSLTSTTWADLDNALDITLAGAAGNTIQIGASGRHTSGGSPSLVLDVVTVVSSAAVNSLGQNAVFGSSSGHGITNWGGHVSGFEEPINGGVKYVLQSNDISDGAVLLRLQYRLLTAGTRSISAQSGKPFLWWAMNIGPVDPN